MTVCGKDETADLSQAERNRVARLAQILKRHAKEGR